MLIVIHDLINYSVPIECFTEQQFLMSNTLSNFDLPRLYKDKSNYPDRAIPYSNPVGSYREPPNNPIISDRNPTNPHRILSKVIGFLGTGIQSEIVGGWSR
ncbi:unnamed protein product [Rotaria socialis]